MAVRVRNRRALREEAEQAKQVNAVVSESAPVAVPPKKTPKPKAPSAPKVKRARAKKVPPRMCARWGVFDAGMKQVAVFGYNQKAAADQKLADLLAKNKGVYFLQIVKEPMPEPAPAEAPSVK